MAESTALSATDLPLGNLGINLGCFFGGLLVGVLCVYLGRKYVRKYSWDGYPALLTGIDAILVFLGTLMTSSLELYRKGSWLTFDKYMAAAFVLMGIIVACGIGSKVLITVSRDAKLKRTAELNREITDLNRQRDAALEVETLLCEVMNAKLSRLAEWRRSGHGSLQEALDPETHIHVLLNVLHGYVSKVLAPNKRIRVGIYMLSEDGVTLEVIYGWDGQSRECFSNRHGALMKLTNPGGGRSLVVECWSGQEAFRCVSNTKLAAQDGRFTFFHVDQAKKICSMVAYRHNMSVPADDAFILTLDSNQEGFFSADIEAKCRLLLPAFAKRIELEQLSLDVV